jgi:hypothetical protein
MSLGFDPLNPPLACTAAPVDRDCRIELLVCAPELA